MTRALGKPLYYELESKANITGRRRITVALHEIFPDAEHWQDNGVSWNETYTRANMGSVKGMSLTAEFVDGSREEPWGHGLTGVQGIMPVFEDATMVGFFEKSRIEDVEINGAKKRVLLADGYIDEMRYPKFVAWLEEALKDGGAQGSVEIVGKPENDGNIVYEGGWKEQGRVPMKYDYSGYAILGVEPADKAAIVLELNQKQEKEEEAMDEKVIAAMKEAVAGAISEQNSKWDEYWAKVQAKEAEIAQLQADIAQREADIAQLRADLEAAEARAAAAEAGIAEMNEKAEATKKESLVGELNAALADYTEDERNAAKDDIDAFMANPGCVEINSIVGKICTEIVRSGRNQQDDGSLIDLPDDEPGDETEVELY